MFKINAVFFYFLYSSISISICFLTKSRPATYKHVVWMHGLFAGKQEFNDIRNFTLTVHPGTTFTVFDMYDGTESLTRLQRQVNHIRPKFEAVMKAHPEGVHLMCYSQGGLVCRGLLETTPNHNVDTFIALSTPQGGQYGDTNYLKKYAPTKKDLYSFFYTIYGQEISIGNYWNDPHHQDLYLKYSDFLAVLNNQSYNKHSYEFKESFLRLKNIVLVGGPDDGVITPWQSSQFAAFDKDEKVVLMKDQVWYQKDSFGLQTLNKRGALHMCTVPGIEHTKWHKNLGVFKKCVQKWLT